MSQYMFSIFIITVLMVVWIPLCISKYRKWHHRKEHCNRKITVQIVEIEKKKAARGGMMYKPIFAVAKDDKIHTIRTAYYTGISTMEIGQTIELLVNPDDYQEFLYVEEKYNYGKITDIMFCLIPFFFAIIIIIATVRKK